MIAQKELSSIASHITAGSEEFGSHRLCHDAMGAPLGFKCWYNTKGEGQGRM
jgi:hypothetical protein